MLSMLGIAINDANNDIIKILTMQLLFLLVILWYAISPHPRSSRNKHLILYGYAMLSTDDGSPEYSFFTSFVTIITLHWL